MPNIDERLDRLTERHEALSQSVELLTADIRTLTAQIAQDAENIRTLAGIARNALASIQSLENIATARQNRLDDHEPHIDDLEK